jgi:tetratricopeptide (TPR) repeat protein
VVTQVEVAQKLYGIYKTIESVIGTTPSISKIGIDINIEVSEESQVFVNLLLDQFERVKMNLDPFNWEIILGWNQKVATYKNPIYSFKVRDKESLQRYLDADENLSEILMKIEYYDTILKYLEEIIKMISNRSFQIKNSIDFLKFQMGM